ncbi:MAG: hypothetical protein LBD75_07665 [Candidatus Peribacteria bacterium]|jgi:hypothetical protein|nr:hypothetical protein [Candidatus Peribacteria bacterium]
MPYTSRETYDFISKQTNDPIVEWKTCKVSGQPFPIYQSDLDFYDKISPTFNGKKFSIPTPTLCPEEREKRRLAFRNERTLYRRKCDFSGKDIVSMYSPDKPFKVYDQKIWRSDQRNPMEYGRDYDFSKSFTENLKALLYEVPLPSLTNLNDENSEYCNWCNYNKNCYLTFMSSYSQDSMYGTFIQRSNDCMDCTVAFECDNCYDCYNVNNCTGIMHSHNCHDCSLSAYLDFCRGCSNCFACHNLYNQQYCILNVPYDRETYFEKIKTITPQQIQEFKKLIQREKSVVKSENSFGRDLTTSKNSILCYNGFEAEDCKYCLNFGDLKDSYDCSAF